MELVRVGSNSIGLQRKQFIVVIEVSAMEFNQFSYIRYQKGEFPVEFHPVSYIKKRV